MVRVSRPEFPRSSIFATISAALVTACASGPSVSPPPSAPAGNGAGGSKTTTAPPTTSTAPSRFEAVFEMPNDRLRAVATSGELVMVVAQSAYYRSTDGGRTFQKAALPHPNPMSIAVVSDRLVYLGSQRCGFARSVDGGRTFEPLRAPSPDSFCAVDSLMVGPDQSLWLAANPPASIWRSTDRGATFSGKPLDDEPTWSIVVKAARDEAVIFGRDAKLEPFMTAVDAKGTKLRSLPLLPGAKYETVCASKGSLFASTDRGILRAKDGDSTWSPVLAKADSSVLVCGERAIVVASVGPLQPLHPQTVAIEVSTSTDQGATFTKDTFDAPVHWQSGVDLGAKWTPGAPPPTSSTPTLPKIAAVFVAGSGETYVALNDVVPGQKVDGMPQLYGSKLYRRGR